MMRFARRGLVPAQMVRGTITVHRATARSGQPQGLPLQSFHPYSPLKSDLGFQFLSGDPEQQKAEETEHDDADQVREQAELRPSMSADLILNVLR